MKKVVKKHLKAMGGARKLKHVNTLEMTGTIRVMGNDAPISLYQKRPHMLCIESKTDYGAFITGFDDETAWTYNSYAGHTEPVVHTGEDIEMRRENSDIESALVDYKKKGNKVELAGTEEFDGKSVFKLVVTHPSGRQRTILIDTETYLAVSETYTQMNEGVISDQELRYSDHKKVDGLTFPHAFEQVANGEVQTVFAINKIKINEEIDDAVFKPRTE
jgi:outer membrane lipoprotein-sorting protein